MHCWEHVNTGSPCFHFPSVVWLYISSLSSSLPPSSSSSSNPCSRSSANVTPTSHKEMFSILRWLSQQCKIRAKTHNTNTHTHIPRLSAQVFKSCLQPLTHRDLAEANPAHQNTEHWDLAALPLALFPHYRRPDDVAFRGRQVADYMEKDCKVETAICLELLWEKW